jgi:gamma-glutamylcyclotransferase (GGCT)/AIG2-like uncharacterized protein YtfP
MDLENQPTALFVYGSLLNPARRQAIIGREVDTIPATLHDYELCRGRYFYVRQQPGVSTTGLLLLNLAVPDLQLLDVYEEIPRLYTREKVEVADDSGTRLRCWIYVPTVVTLGGGE